MDVLLHCSMERACRAVDCGVLNVLNTHACPLLNLSGIVLQRSPNSSGHSRGQDSGRSAGGNRSGRHNEPVPPPPQQQQQQDSGRPKEKNNGYVVRPPGSEPLDGHRRYTKIREINSGAE